MRIKLNNNELSEFIELRSRAERLRNKIVKLKLELDEAAGDLKLTERLQDGWMHRFSTNSKLPPASLLEAKFDTAQGVVILPDPTE